MGNWRIEVEGIGCHHNGQDFDVEAITVKYLDDLRARGHLIQRVRVVAGGWSECYHDGLSLVPEVK